MASNLQQLRQNLPLVRSWIERALADHAAQAHPVDTLDLPRLGLYFPPTLLSEARVIPVLHVPVPPLSKMGLEGFTEFEELGAAGITYLDSFFIRHGHEHDESLHFHELVHVVQWRHLGPDRFIMAYAIGHLLTGGYYTNPLEIMAYTLQSRFDHHEPAFDVVPIIHTELDHIVPSLFRAAGFGP